MDCCSLHKDGKYRKWKCSAYSPGKRRERYLKGKMPCPVCSKGLVSKYSKQCKACAGKQTGERQRGMKLPDWWKKRISDGQTGNKHHSWKGDMAGYSALHHWLRKHYGNPLECFYCNKRGEKVGRAWNLQWANIDGEYRRDIKNWFGLCAKCHGGHDKKLKDSGVVSRIYWLS